MNDVLKKATYWCSEIFDKETRHKTQQLINDNSTELQDSFYKNLEFGTGGMRGIMGVGTNRINKYTLGKNTQGIANYLKKQFPDEPLKVAIAYDCRNNSKDLAQVVAQVFSANNIRVYLFSDLRPTPELSFAVKHLNCQCGIVLTASHNPPEYNGYKVYWKDGGQLVPPQDQEIISEINTLSYNQINFSTRAKFIEYIDQEVDIAFIKASVTNGKLALPDKARKNLSIVFTSLHGTSITLVPPVLEKSGYTQVHVVDEQAKPDGNFPTIKSPNPEEPEALKMALAIAEKKNADIVIGTDPDGDRLGIAVRDHKGNMKLLNGNQTMVLMTDFLLKKYQIEKGFQGHEFIASTIVSTPMMQKLAAHYGVECKVGLTGFKWIAKMIKDYPKQQFIGGGEESFGYMVSDFVRDKDAVTATLLACEIAAHAKQEGSSVYGYLLDLYQTHDLHKEHLVSLVKKGKEGAEEINRIMDNLRNNSPKKIAQSPVIRIEDYACAIAKNILSGTEEKLTIPQSNVLIFYTKDGCRIAARPSGTEPKIKFYVSVKKAMKNGADFVEAEQELTEKINQILNDLPL